MENTFSQNINYESLKLLPTLIDSASNQVLIYLDSIPENIFFPHTIYWDGKKWVMKIEFENNFPNQNIKAAITEKGLLFFIFPEIESEKYLIFEDGKWKETKSLSTKD